MGDGLLKRFGTFAAGREKKLIQCVRRTLFRCRLVAAVGTLGGSGSPRTRLAALDAASFCYFDWTPLVISVSPNIIQYFVLSQRKRFLSIAAGGRHVTIWSEADLWRPWSPKASGRKKGSWTSFTIGSEISGGFRSRSTFPLVDCRVFPASEAQRGFLKE
ncbi:hypothetical protein V5799_017303 [Amblyomma americanum]|uniref:Uncharacterized protein n=1 Tax=Amblyomma americanum TaxID=6943 RepID=A0AAQ4F2N2_AMBAM